MLKEDGNIVTLPSWQVIPTDVDFLVEWADVDHADSQNRHGLRIYHLLYSSTVLPPDPGTSRKQVLIWLQGFIKMYASKVQEIGTDESTSSVNHTFLNSILPHSQVHNAPKAIQFIELESKGQEAPFNVQKQCLETVHELIHISVWPHVQPGQQPVCSFIDSSNSRAADACKCAHQPGDFIDVSVFTDIALSGTGDHARTHVHFTMNEIVHLQSAGEIKALGVKLSSCVVPTKSDDQQTFLTTYHSIKTSCKMVQDA
ncbi:uncharacterized protein LAESUDRAFT_718466 [Laetiporus sulphureus 93-53]|uniref:Uncharacterized protein n=1 Tax=Laetiporus sulphureus 93-53 TaxID=1314785 RepID=A0A165AXT7_9APHY|nr:uncharacterized protein LAESUDRAFT_718466 [Laetiporus sulphureus 93-53]KZS99862.1 hypothetical protein LAESUDRAFT_718466 [Laetiporus sulphureus 93-53]